MQKEEGSEWWVHRVHRYRLVSAQDSGAGHREQTGIELSRTKIPKWDTKWPKI